VKQVQRVPQILWALELRLPPYRPLVRRGLRFSFSFSVDGSFLGRFGLLLLVLFLCAASLLGFLLLQLLVLIILSVPHNINKKGSCKVTLRDAQVR
jgi:hypothetical protein